MTRIERINDADKGLMKGLMTRIERIRIERIIDED